MTWLQNNYGNIIILSIVGLIMFLCIRSLIKDKKAGVPSCGAKSCSGCGGSCALQRKESKQG